MQSKLVVLRTCPEADLRVPLTPVACGKLKKIGWDIWVESKAGIGCGYDDVSYQDVATVSRNLKDLCHNADVLLTVAPPSEVQLKELPESCTVIGLLGSHDGSALWRRHNKAFNLELLPRSSATQIFDVLTSQSSLYGYWAVLMGGAHLKRVMPMMSTPAGRLPPARVLVLGAGVAGLQAIATAKRLGAVVSAFDVRESARGGVESLDAHFYTLQETTNTAEDVRGYATSSPEEELLRHREIIHPLLSSTDLVVATAMVPGKEPPILLTADMVQVLPFGSVIVDIAADRWIGHHKPTPSGNCALSARGHTIVHDGVTIIAPAFGLNAVAQHASDGYANNLQALLSRLWDHDTKSLGAQDSWVEAMRLSSVSA